VGTPPAPSARETASAAESRNQTVARIAW
jgi:hypothetical protein